MCGNAFVIVEPTESGAGHATAPSASIDMSPRRPAVLCQLFSDHATQANQRANITQLTVLFDAFGFDLHSRPYPTLSAQRVGAARDHARKELNALKRRFPPITIVGALELEPIDGPTKARRKNSSAIDTLVAMGAANLVTPLQASTGFFRPLACSSGRII